MELAEIIQRVSRGESVELTRLAPYLYSDEVGIRTAAHKVHALMHLFNAQRETWRALEASDFADGKTLHNLHSICLITRDETTRVEGMISYGRAMIERGQIPVGLEATGAACCADIGAGIKYLSDPERAGEIARSYELAGRRTRELAGLSQAVPAALDGRIRVAYVVPNLIDDVNAPSQRIANLIRHHNRDRFDIRVYSSEELCRRSKPLFFIAQLLPPTAARAPKILKLMQEMNTPFYAAPLDGTLVDSAVALARKIVADGTDVAVFQASLACPVICLIAGWKVAPAQVNINIGVPMYVEGIDCTTYFMRGNYERELDYWRSRGRKAVHLPGGIDPNPELPPAPTKASIGIDDRAVIMMTVGAALGTRMSDQFIQTMCEILRNNPQALYLVVGQGEFVRQRERFKTAGLTNRVRFAGTRNDVRSFLRVADIYVNEFPSGGAQSVLEAMSAGLAVVAMRYSNQHLHCCGAEYVGPAGTIVGADPTGYFNLVSRLIQEPDFRAEQGRAMRRRVEDVYAFAKTVQNFEKLYEELMEAQGARHSRVA